LSKPIVRFYIIFIILALISGCSDKKSDRKADVNNQVEEDYTSLPELSISENSETFSFHLSLPPGEKYNKYAPFKIKFRTSKRSVLVIDTATIIRPATIFTLPVDVSPGKTDLYVEASLNYCNTENEDICFLKDIRLEIPVTVSSSGSTAFRLDYNINH